MEYGTKMAQDFTLLSLRLAGGLPGPVRIVFDAKC
jgi:hypothetical protein